MMSEALGGNVPLTTAAEIKERIDNLLDRCVAAKAEDRLTLTLEYITLKEALDDAKAGQVIGYVTDSRTASD